MTWPLSATLSGKMIPPRLGQGRPPATGWIGRLPHQTWALAICALALLFGVAAADDYGVWLDTYDLRGLGEATLRHLAGENGINLIWPEPVRLYGPIFEAPLALIERILDRDDSRSVYLTRYLLTHLFFLAAAFAGYALAYRLFGSRWLALFALLLFLLHPRIYAQSFFNSKDMPFLAMFMICLWLAHRAFGASGNRPVKDGVAIYGAGAFALLGVAAGLLTNLRIIGLVFVALVAFLCLCDIFAAGVEGRRRATGNGALFTLFSVATYYATMPYLWADPVERFMEILRVLSAHPHDHGSLFLGEVVAASDLPRSYLPVWFGITTPPLALLLGAVGFAALVWRVVARLFPPTGALGVLLRNTPLRFELLVAGCFVLPVLTAIVLRPPLHSDWRHFYFLWSPFVLLATSGLKGIAEGARHRLQHLRVGGFATAVAPCLAMLCLAAMAVEMARLHPHQYLYFNALANRPGAAVPLRQRFDLWDMFHEERGYAYILEELASFSAGAEDHPDAVFNIWRRTLARKKRRGDPLGVGMDYGNMELFHERDQRRFEHDPNADFDFYVIGRQAFLDETPFAPLLYERRLYGQQIVRVATPDLSRVDEATANIYRALYREVTSSAPALSGPGAVDVYRGERGVHWVMEPCPPGAVNDRMRMTVVPLDAAQGLVQVPPAYGVRVGDACLWQATLPDQPIAKLLFPRIGALATDAHLRELRRQRLALTASPPVARSTFDVYLGDRTLFYVKASCVQKDAQAPFFVHVRPARIGDLPRSRRLHGFDTLDFRFGGFDTHWNYAASDFFDGVCMATLKLPDYPVASIATGQYVRGADNLWRVHVDVGEEDRGIARHDDSA